MGEKLTEEQVVERLLEEAEKAYARYDKKSNQYDYGLHEGLQIAAVLVRQHLCEQEANK